MHSPATVRPELFYITLSLLGGLVFALATPPGAGPDEIAHAAKAIQIANGRILDLPKGDRFPNMRSMFAGLTDDVTEPAFRIDIDRLKYVASRPINCEPEPAPIKYGASAYPPMPYAAPAIVYRAACITDAPFGVFLYGGRLLNLLLATAIIAFSIRLCPFGKWTLAVLGLLPSSVFEASVLSADGLTNGAAFLWIALAVKAATQTELLTGRSIAALFGAGLLLALAKPGYQILLLAFLMIPRGRFPSLRAQASTIALVVGVPLLVTVTWVAMNAGGLPSRPGVDQSANLDRVLTEPTHGIVLLVSTLAQQSHEIVKQAIGVLGWLDVHLPVWAYVTWAGALCLSLFANPIRVGLHICQRALLLAVVGAGVIAVLIPLYLTWTPPESPSIMGLQGRYFIPLLVPLAVAISSGGLGRKQRLWLIGAIMALCIIGTFAAVTALIERYYVSTQTRAKTVAFLYDEKIVTGKDGIWYVVRNGERYRVPSSEWFTKSGKKPPIVVHEKELAVLPMAPSPCPAPKTVAASALADLTAKYGGRIVRQTHAHCERDSGWFLIENGHRRWIVDSAWVTRRGMSAADVLVIPYEDLMAIPEDPRILQ